MHAKGCVHVRGEGVCMREGVCACERGGCAHARGGVRMREGRVCACERGGRVHARGEGVCM